MVLTILGLLLFSRMPVDGSYAADVLPGMILSSLGMGAIFMPLTLIATTGLENEDQGLASGLFNTSQQVGGALGLAILSTIAASHTNGHSRTLLLVNGFHYAFVGAAVLVGLSLVVFVALLRKRRRREDRGRHRDGTGAGRLMTELRADARRNLERVLDAAEQAFAASGPDASIDEIARLAGVGHGTVFRRFPTKDDLMYAVIERHVAQLSAMAEEALASDDPGEAFFDFARRAAELGMTTPGLHKCVVHCGEKPGAAELEQLGAKLVCARAARRGGTAGREAGRRAAARPVGVDLGAAGPMAALPRRRARRPARGESLGLRRELLVERLRPRGRRRPRPAAPRAPARRRPRAPRPRAAAPRPPSPAGRARARSS